MKFASISNGQYVNQYDSEVRLTVVGATTGSDEKDVELFSTVFPVPSGQFQISLDPVLGKTKALNDIFNKRGFLGGTTSGEVQLTEKTTSITLKTDYVFLNANKKGIELSRNVLDAMIKGEGFIHSNKYVKVLGTNGSVKHGFLARTNRFFGKLFELDGRLVIADAATPKGNAITVGNIRKTAYDKTCNYMILEIISKFDDQTGDGLRLVYTMNSDVSWSDATDANEVSFTNTQLSDVRMIDKFFIEGFDVVAETGLNIPARRIQVAKTPVSMFKAVAALDGASGAVIGLTPGVANTTITLGYTTQTNVNTVKQPLEVIVGDLAKGEFKEAYYTPASGDIVAVYVPGTTVSGSERDAGYALGLIDGTPVETKTVSTVIVSTITPETKTIATTGNVDFAVNDVVIINAHSGTDPDVRLLVTSIPTATSFTYSVISGDVTDIIAADTIDIVKTTATFKLIKNDYRIAEANITSTSKTYITNEDTCATASIFADTLADALIHINEWNFEESIFERVSTAGGCSIV